MASCQGHLLRTPVNFFLFQPSEIKQGHGIIHGEKFRHLQFLGKKPGETVKAGILNGNLGQVTITDLKSDFAEFKGSFTIQPPVALPLELSLALPRPKVLNRMLQHIISLGIKKLNLFHCYRVEKSYWQTNRLLDESLYRVVLSALEQAGDTVAPEIRLLKYFKPYVEDELACRKAVLVAQPGGRPFSTYQGKIGNKTEPWVVVIGPAGGFIKYELDLFRKNQAELVSFGSRILYQEAAASFIVGCIQHRLQS